MQYNINRPKFQCISNLTFSADFYGLLASEESLFWKNQFPCSQKHVLSLDIEGNKISCFPRDQSLSDLLLYGWKFIKPRCNSGCRTTFAGNRALLPSDVIDFTMLPAQRFWRETMSCDLEVSNESACCWENFQL